MARCLKQQVSISLSLLPLVVVALVAHLAQERQPLHRGQEGTGAACAIGLHGVCEDVVVLITSFGAFD